MSNMLLIVSLCTGIIGLFTAVISRIMIVAKLKWETEKQESEIKKNALDINNLGSKLSNVKEDFSMELKSLNARIDELDRQMIQQSTTLGHIQEMLREIKEKLND